MKIQGSKWLVTGGASGMGKAFVMNLLEDGADVAFCDLGAEAVAATQAEGEALGKGKVAGFVANVAREEEVVALLLKAREALGGLDALINNAGIFRDGLLVKPDKATGAVKTMSLSQWQTVIDVDLTGPFLCTREFAKGCIESGTTDAVVISISSISRHGNPGQTNYSAAKAGLVADTKLWANELARYGIRTGVIAPGFIETPILQGMRPEVLEKMIAPVPLKRLGKPREIYLAAKFIAECDYFTGRCLDVDGGLVL
jgi:3-oxoacyl-[acyl-carrier protein] reductase